MRARVLEVSEEQIYLEVDEQLRFKIPYVLNRQERKPTSDDDVEFRFSRILDRKTVIIESVIEHPSNDTR